MVANASVTQAPFG